MVRRRSRQGKVLIWCREFSHYARQRMGQKLMERVQDLEEDRIPARKARNWKIGGPKKKDDET